MITIADVENTVVKHDKGIDLSPYNPGNKLVSVGLGHISDNSVALLPYVFLDHKDHKGSRADFDQIQSVLNKTTLLVGHNLKHDLAWLLEAGFKYEGACYDTMIGEYVLSRGLKDDLSLEGSCIRRNVTLKKSDIFHRYFDKGHSVDEIPIDELKEYGEGDIVSTGELFLAQRALYANKYNAGLVPTLSMMNDFLYVLTDMERNGIKIDLNTLDTIEVEYREELADLHHRLGTIKQKVMGDTPINLASPEQLSCLIYSRRVKDKKAWAETFHIGLNARGKPLPRPDMSAGRFAANVREQTELVRKTQAQQCVDCKGTGHYYRTRINGEFHKRPTKCPHCGGSGIIYRNIAEYAGLRQSPRNIWDCTANGFATDKETLTLLAESAAAKGNQDAADFLSAMVRVNAIETYLSSFVGGIRRNTRPDGILHPRFNQCITATGRLSSSDPNAQNWPRGGTFPVKGALVSRFTGGKLTEVDFSGLEFRIAGELSGDSQIFTDVTSGKDIHSQTASIIQQKDATEIDKDERQNAKPHSFAPLYGATGANQLDHIATYYKEFFTIYKGVAKWHERLEAEALTNKQIRIPSGREYAFPHIKRMQRGVTSRTQLVNYPVQGFATADIVPCAVIRVARRFKRESLKSILILTVHDSLVADTHPDELDVVARIMVEECLAVKDELKIRYGYAMKMPLAVECKRGDNLLNTRLVEFSV